MAGPPIPRLLLAVQVPQGRLDGKPRNSSWGICHLVDINLSPRPNLVHVLTAGVAGGVAAQKAKHEQGHKEGDYEVNHNLKGEHELGLQTGSRVGPRPAPSSSQIPLTETAPVQD